MSGSEVAADWKGSEVRQESRGEERRVMGAQRSEAKGIPASSLIGEEMSAILDCSGEKRLMR
ncbi:hypothetical protein INR49_019395 [Caranx melampygus]|nr:hypothetical protein INR49_019395 [Caranx melampygus]